MEVMGYPVGLGLALELGLGLTLWPVFNPASGLGSELRLEPVPNTVAVATTVSMNIEPEKLGGLAVFIMQ